MTLLSATSISKIYKDQTILKDVSFSLESSHRIGLVGKNGIGKTTLLEMLAGKISCDTGNITRSRQCRIDYVEQEKTDHLDQSLFEFVAAARQDLLDQRTEIHELELYLAERPSDDAAVTKLGQLQETFEAGGGFDFENEIGIILTGLGFDRDRYTERMRNFSGGEKNRAGLARLLAGNGNLLLLDEPTNHLDIESTAWLEDYLRKVDRAYIVVSHDRAFLANTADEIWEIGLGKIERYTGGFENYLRERDERRRLAAHHYRHQQEEIKRIEEFIRRNMAGQKTKQAQSKLKYLGRMKRLPPPRTDGSGPVIKVTSSGRSFAHVLSCHDASLGYGDTTVLSDVSFDLYRGEKVGVVGRNGSGKSTLLKSLIGELEPERGNVKLGSNIEVAYFDQDLADLNLESSVLDSVWELDPVADAHTIRSFLARFGFTGEDAFKKVMSLSGGEKTKLCLARLLYRPANFIILDEPTNHLDIDSRFALEKALQEYDGTLLMVSHDRFFLQSVANRILYVCDGETSMYDGNYAYFTERHALAEQTTEEPKEKKGKQAYLDFKEQSRRRSRHKKSIQSTRNAIEQKEVELGELESQLNGVIPADDWQKLQEVSKQKQDTEHEILELYIRLEQLEAEELD